MVAGVERAAHEALIAALGKGESTDELVTEREGSGGYVGILVEEVHVDVPRVEVDDGVIGVGLISQLRVVISTSLSRKRREEEILVSGSGIFVGGRLHSQSSGSESSLGILSAGNLVLLVKSRQVLVTGNKGRKGEDDKSTEHLN